MSKQALGLCKIEVVEVRVSGSALRMLEIT